MRPIVLSSVLAHLASACAAGPIFLSLEYTGDAQLAGVDYTGIAITAQAKGLTTDVSTTQTAQGTRHDLLVSMVIHLDGVGSLDIPQDIRFFSFSDLGAIGFERPGAPQPTFIAIAPDLAGFDLRTSVGPTMLLGGNGNPALILQTALGALALGAMESGTFTSFAFMPAPGPGVALAIGLVLAARRRERPETSG